MKYLISSDRGLTEAEDLSPKILAAISAGDLLVLRYSVDRFEYAEVTSRSVDDPNNSWDETRYDQAIDGQIYEIASWHPFPRYNGEDDPLPAAGEGPITVIGEKEIDESLIRDLNATDEERRTQARERLDKTK